MSPIFLVLLLTVGAAEQTYGPYPRPMFGGNHSVVAARGNVLLAWSEKDASGHARIHVALLDAAGRAISPVRVLPALNPDREALVPAVGTDGASFLVVWEEAFGVQQTVAMGLAPDGTPVGEPHPLGTDLPVWSNHYASARVHWTAGSYVVLTGPRRIVRVSASGELLATLTGPAPEAVSRDGTFARAEFIVVPGGFPPFGGGRPTPTVRWVAGSRFGMDATSGFASPPYITAVGNEFLVTWTTDGFVHYRFTNASRALFLANVDEFSRMHADCAETRCVVAYTTRTQDVEGFVVDGAAPSAPPLRFTVANSDRDEREPAVAMITGSRALVTWRSAGPGGEKLSGRPLRWRTKSRAVN